MKRLLEGKGKNSPEEYGRILLNRASQSPNFQDKRRWKKLASRYEGGWLLDIGCLDSMVIPYARKRSKIGVCYGIDTAPIVKEHMTRLYPYAYFYQEDLFTHGFLHLHFNYIVMGELLEHLEDPQKAIERAMGLLQPGGTLALSVPCEETELGEVDKERHLWSFSPEDIRQLLEPYGTVEIEILRSRYFPYKYAFPSIIAFVQKHEDKIL